jgi:D-glycero-alpha-D-manno-heptose-7-phosphate kinase
MIVAKAPLRVSFLGGGSDYPAHYEKHGGAVLGSAIDKHVYVALHERSPRFFDSPVRASYAETDYAESVAGLSHAPFRACLQRHGVESAVAAWHAADLPSMTGLGSSSAFVVAALAASRRFAGHSYDLQPMALAARAVGVERRVLGETVGCQDQAFAALGGFRFLRVCRSGRIVDRDVRLGALREEELERSLHLYYVGRRKRPATEMAAEQCGRAPENAEALRALARMAGQGLDLLENGGSLDRFGGLLHDAWSIKRGLLPGLCPPDVDELYDAARAAGAWGGKLCGAGGGGFLMLLVPRERRLAVGGALRGCPELGVRLRARGVRVWVV